MKIIRILAAVLAISHVNAAEAQTIKKSSKNRKIGEAISDIYFGGVKWGTAVVTPDRNEQQTIEGSTGGLQAVGGGAALASAIGGVPNGLAAGAMAVPIVDGAEPVAIWNGSSHRLARIQDLVDKGDGATLAREEFEGIRHRQEAGERYRSTLNHAITSPGENNSSVLAEKFADYQRDTIPNAQRYAASNTQTAVNTQKKKPAKEEGWDGTIDPSPDQSASLNQDETPIEEQDDAATQDALPFHWKTVSAVARTNGQVVPVMGMEIGKCEPLQATDAYEYIAMERAAPEGFGQNCSAAQFLDNSRDRITYTQSCQDPDTGAVEVHNSLRAKDARTIESYLKLNLGGGATSELQAVMAYCG